MSSSGYGDGDGIYRNPCPVVLPSHPHQGFPSFLFRGEIGDPRNAAKPLLIDSSTGFTITCSGFRRLVSALSNGLASILGLSHGDVVLLLLGNTVYFPVIFNAVLSLGAVVTTANPANTTSEIRRQQQDSAPRFVFCTPEYVAKVQELGVPVILLGGPHAEHPTAFVPFERLLESEPKPSQDIRLHLGDPAVILYSSGTTGPSKGVILTHGNLIAAVSSAIASKPQHEEQEEDDAVVSFILLPMFHVAALVWLGCAALRAAATLVVVQRFDFVHMLELIERYRITNLPLVPPIVVGLLKHPAVGKYDLSSLRRASSGAAPLRKDTIDAFLARFPQIKEFSQGYGLTETTGAGAAGLAPFGCAGRLMPTFEAKVVDFDTGRPLPPNQVGELWLRGPTLMQGYLNNPKATAETIDEDGWLHTGDLVFIDTDAFVYVVDRLKELIKYKGFQVAPAELEALLLTHPGIADAAVVPFPDEDAGEVPLAYVVPEPGQALTEEQVMTFVAQQVAPHKKVRRVVFLDTIPKTVSGKIQRKDLVKLARSKL